MAKTREARFDPHTWSNAGNPSETSKMLYWEWNIGGFIFTLRDLATNGWALHVKQTHHLGRAKLVFTKDGSFISFKSHGQMFHHTHAASGFCMTDLFTNMKPIKIGFTEQETRKYTRQGRKVIAAKNPITEIPPEDMNQYYQAWVANKATPAHIPVEINNDALIKPYMESTAFWENIRDRNSFVKCFDANLHAFLEHRPTGVRFYQDGRIEKPPVIPNETVKPISEYSDLELLNEILSRPGPKPKRKETPPLTPENIVDIKEWLRRSEAIQEDQVQKEEAA